MFFSTTILASVGFLAALAQGSPASQLARAEDFAPKVFLDENGAVESFEKAARLGIDIFGPIPSDARRVDDHWEADPDTKAWAWIRAQADIDWDAVSQDKRDELEKRQGSGPAQINISVWTGDNCTSNDNHRSRLHVLFFINYGQLIDHYSTGSGGVIYWDNVSYNVHYYSGSNLYSVGVSLRGVRGNEHLDLSRYLNGDACGQFVTRVVGGSK